MKIKTYILLILLCLALSVPGITQSESNSGRPTKQEKAYAMAQEQARENAQKSQQKAQKDTQKSQQKAQKAAQKSQKKAQKQWSQQHPSVH